MDYQMLPYTLDRIPDVLDFEARLRQEENFWGWEIDDQYIQAVTDSFQNSLFSASLSFLAYAEGSVVGRIDIVKIPSRFDGSVKAYLDWICVLKTWRHRGVAQAMLSEALRRLKADGIHTLIALTASNEEAQRFYKNIPNSSMRDVGIWIDIK